MRLLFDTESDGLLNNATKIHCIAVINVDTEEVFDFKPDQIDEGLALLSKASVLIGHNIQRHDIPLLTKLTGWTKGKDVVIRDTMVCARVIYPNVKATDPALIRNGQMPPGRDYAGKHTIAAWGYRLGEHKGDYAQIKEAEARALGFDDEEAIKRFVWGFWNPEMHDYMIQDCKTNLALWNYLRVDKYSKDAIDLEHRAARVCDAINEAGVPFDTAKGGLLHAALIDRKEVIEKDLQAKFGFWLAPISPTKAVFTPKKDSKPSVWTLLTNKKTGEQKMGWSSPGYTAGAPMSKLKVVEFNPGSRDNIIKVLLDKGWKPESYTQGGKPEINEEIIEGIVQRFPEMSGIGEYLMVDKRLSQLADGKQAWLTCVQDDGRIHGVINPMGTITSRGAHMWPNLGQVPNAASPYGPECRALFTTIEGYTFLGADMSGLELRGLGHYLALKDAGKYMETAVSGDVHWMNACAMGLAEGERDKHSTLHTIIREDGSKRFIYAYIYGCGDGKAGEIIYACLSKAKREGGDEGAALYAKFFGDGIVGEEKLKRVGKKVRDGFANSIDGFSDLKKKLERQVEKFGWVPGLDGRRIPTRSEHSALNFMIQSCGAILCKRWMADVFDELCERYTLGKDFQFVLWVHDEIQLLVKKGLEEEIIEVIKRHGAAAGVPYNFRGPLKVETKQGTNWSETH